MCNSKPRGSIADNICFFDESVELEHMMRCAELAGIHEEICNMPMVYNSLIGDGAGEIGEADPKSLSGSW